jgi:hypothetical protein
MKTTRFKKTKNRGMGKIDLPHVVNKTNKNIVKSFTEVLMNFNIIATLSAFGIGLLVFLVHRINLRIARQPILIENRRIIYKRDRT